MIALDTTALSLLFIPGAVARRRGSTTPIKYAKERMEGLVERIAQAGDTILIPTPALSEMFVKLTPVEIQELLPQLNRSPWFRVESFDTAAAVELGLRTAQAIADGDKKEGSKADWTKVKFDRQIITIAIVNRATGIISDDPHVKAIGDRWNFPVTSVEDLPVPAPLIPPPLLDGLDAEEPSPEAKEE